jgi:hypothetical protein
MHELPDHHRGATPHHASGACPTCGRRFRATTKPESPASLPLFEWAARRDAAPPRARLILMDTARDADGMPRAALLIPGRRLPTAFPSLAAALAAQAHMEAMA